MTNLLRIHKSRRVWRDGVVTCSYQIFTSLKGEVCTEQEFLEALKEVEKSPDFRRITGDTGSFGYIRNGYEVEDGNYGRTICKSSI